jgi:enamine deaminase RidA (YjgF/YER057c/UK114 family)
MSFDAIFMALPDLPAPAPAINPESHYAPYIINGNVLFLSGNGPLDYSTNPPSIPQQYLGKLGREVTLDTGYMAARLTAMNLLMVVRQALGTLDSVSQILCVEGNVNSMDDFTGQPSVLNGCSDLLVEVFGPTGLHTRSALGSNTLAFDICVEISMSLAIKTS